MTGPDHRGDGDGWTECARGHRHWGLFGAAGVLLHRPGSSVGADIEVLLQHRVAWSHHGETWGLLGGARHRVESAEAGALREAGEEADLGGAELGVQARFVDDHGGWTYSTVLAATDRSAQVQAAGRESIEVRWWPASIVGRDDGPPLHPGFASTWPLLRDQVSPTVVVVDAANVVGSRPDGWWRDRAGAASRLLSSCARLAANGMTGTALSVADPGRELLAHCWPRYVVVLEGQARLADPPAYGEGVEVRHAGASGDDELVAAVRGTAGGTGRARVIVVTADRGLRDRVTALGALTVGPSWLLAHLPPG